MRVLVVGGGIAGLTAAWRLRTVAEVTVLDAGDRLGGKLRTETLDGIQVETGADAFLGRELDAADLCREVGLGSALVAPAVAAASIWWNGSLHPLPAGVLLGVPTRVRELIRSSLLTRRGVTRATLDLVLPRNVDPEVATVGELVRRRLGREVAERLAEPLLSGVYAGDIDRLSASAATPVLTEAARSRSMIAGARRRLRGSGPGPVFLTVRDGLSALVDALAAELDTRTNCEVRRVERSGDRYLVLVEEEGALEADAVIVAVPATTAAHLLADDLPNVAEPLRAIPYASVGVLTAVFPAGTELPPGSGMLVPRRERRLVKAATWVSQKWPHTAPDGRVVIRASVGSRDDVSALSLDDDVLIERIFAELAELAGINTAPDAVRLTRWVDALPQYEVGHRERVRQALAAAATHRGIVLAGAAYHGVGIPACVRDGDRAAQEVLAARR